MLKRHSAKAVLEGELERLVGTWGRPMSNHDTMDALIGVGVLLAMVLFVEGEPWHHCPGNPVFAIVAKLTSGCPSLA
jgi:hypothetical protein